MNATKNYTRPQKLRVALVSLLVVAIASLFVKALLVRMDNAIEQNGESNMQAIVEQLEQSYELQVKNYYSRLRIVESYAAQGGSDLLSDDDFTRLVKAIQDETSWQIVFLKDNGSATSVDGSERRLDVPSSLLSDLAAGQSVAKLITYASGEGSQSKFLLAIPCQAYELGGRTFTAIGALVDRSEMDSVLKLYAYSGDAFVFMLNSDDEVIYTNQMDEKLFNNYSLLKHLKTDSALTDEQVSALQGAFDGRETGAGQYGEDRAYYLAYAPIKNSSFTVVCIVAKNVVDASLSSYQKMVLASTLVMATILLALFAALFISMWRRDVANRRAAYQKESLKQQGQSLKQLEALNAELESAQSATAQALQSATAANKAKTSFLASMSHDIRTPMNAIIGLASLIEHDAGNESRVREYVRRIQVSSQNLLAILNEVLDMNRIESGMTTLNYADFSVVGLAHDAEDMFRPQAEAKGQTFELVVKDVRHEWLYGDAVRLMQIVSNLLSNAIKYTQPGGRVELAVEEQRSGSPSLAKLRIVVQDNGMGMDEDFQDKIFDAFTREESTLTNKIQGTGLGMAITKNLVDLMGGTIVVNSKKGQGSCFEVLLSLQVSERGAGLPQGRPCEQGKAGNQGEAGKRNLPGEQLEAAEQGEREAGQAAGRAEASLEGMKFLCAEDNALNAEILAELLKMEGASCIVCENGKELLETFERSRPGEFDMILMDVQMPVMNGYEATRAIRQSSHELAGSMPIIAMTANAFSEDIQASLLAGMNAHVSKPIDMDVLKRTVANLH